MTLTFSQPFLSSLRPNFVVASLRVHLCTCYILSRTVSKLLQIIGHIFAFYRKLPLFNTLVPPELTINKFCRKKLETYRSSSVNTFRYLESFSHESRV